MYSCQEAASLEPEEMEGVGSMGDRALGGDGAAEGP